MSTQTVNIKKTAREFEQMVTDVITKQGMFTPVSKDVIRYKNFVIKHQPDGLWAVFAVDKTKTHIATTFLKVSAFAVCRLSERRQSMKLDEVLRTDTFFSKHYIDSIYFKHTIKNSACTERQDIAQWRYELAHSQARQAKDTIDRVFYAAMT